MRIREVCIALMSILLSAGSCTGGQANPLINGSFEQGGASPTGWSLNGPGAYKKDGGATGARYVSISAPDEAEWRSDPVSFTANEVYELRFMARCRPGKGTGQGSIVVETDFSTDIYPVQADSRWRPYTFRLVTGIGTPDVKSTIRLRHWQANCNIDFDDIEILPVVRQHLTQQGLVLGSGESVEGNQYEFRPDYSAEAPIDRAFHTHNTQFHENRWFMLQDSFVEYQHELKGVRITQAAIEVDCLYHQPTTWKLKVEASIDGTHFVDIGQVSSSTASANIEIPSTMLPADRLQIRMSIDSADNKTPGWFALTRYVFKAKTDKSFTKLMGSTTYWAVQRPHAGLVITPVPGADD